MSEKKYTKKDDYFDKPKTRDYAGLAEKAAAETNAKDFNEPAEGGGEVGSGAKNHWDGTGSLPGCPNNPPAYLEKDGRKAGKDLLGRGDDGDSTTSGSGY
jgi:hypothetical protein